MTRIAVDGIDCAGTTTFADRLGGLLGGSRSSVDDGELSTEGCYRDPHDVARFREAVLRGRPPVIADGVVLQRHADIVVAA